MKGVIEQNGARDEGISNVAELGVCSMFVSVGTKRGDKYDGNRVRGAGAPK